MVLISGGTDGGDQRKVVEIAELIAPAKHATASGGSGGGIGQLRSRPTRHRAVA